MNEYEAKFQRERQDHPSDWVIVPILDNGKPSGRYRLQFVGENTRRERTLQHGTV